MLAPTTRTARSRRSGGHLLEELPDQTVGSVPRIGLPGILMLSALLIFGDAGSALWQARAKRRALRISWIAFPAQLH